MQALPESLSLLANYKGRPLSSIGELVVLLFHKTKNVFSGEGGALHVSTLPFVELAELIRENDTKRSQFVRGRVGVGSSYLPGGIITAFLQNEEVQSITRRRLAMWGVYHQWFADAEHAGKLRRPLDPGRCVHNAHMRHVLLPNLAARVSVIARRRRAGVQSVVHCVPLRGSPS